MTRIAVFCDGTWNSPHIPERTSVFKIYEAVESDFDKGQLTAYFAGIGTDSPFDGPVKSFLNTWGGGAFGWGLDSKVKLAYQFLAQAYREGDEIYLFGFSRGAFTARSVAGMIRKCGIVKDTSPDGINRAFELYQTKGDAGHPDAKDVWAQRREMSPEFATSQEDLDMRADDSKLVNIAYVGVFDTVGARGIPVSIFGVFATLWNQKYKFHDMKLSSLVRSARHALAVDERRVFYVPARWDNLDTRNAGEVGPFRPYQQTWFVGTHSIVGGSGATQELAVIPMEWLLRGADKLALKQGADMPHVAPDAEVATEEVKAEWGLLKKWRKAPGGSDEVHASVKARVKARSEYRPKTLSSFISKWLRE
jgi:uncharacterized protein (DUF2235 family)